MILEQEEQKMVHDIMANYKSLHDEIARVEVSIREVESEMKKLHKDKDDVVKGIEDNRNREAELFKNLVEKYGEGKIDVSTMSWHSEIKQD